MSTGVKRKAAAGLTVLALALAAAGPAHASVVAREPLHRGGPTLAVAPVFAGRSVAWGEQSARRTLVKTGRRTFTAPTASADGAVTSLAAMTGTPTRIAVQRAVRASDDPSLALATLDAGPPDGPLRTLVASQPIFTGVACEGGLAGGATSVTASGPSLAWVETRCDGNDPAVSVRAQSRPGAAPRTIATGDLGGLGPLALAGRYLAYRTAQAITVTDVARGEPAYTAPLDATAKLVGLAVQDDGKVAATLGDGRLVWFAPGEAPHTVASASFGPPRLAADRIAVDVRDRSGVHELRVLALDGRVLARIWAHGLSAGTSGGPAADFDGSRLTYATQRAGVLRILVRPI